MRICEMKNKSIDREFRSIHRMFSVQNDFELCSVTVRQVTTPAI